MRKILTASQDASLYQAYPKNNTGLDEILEVGKVINITNLGVTSSADYATGSVRALIKFELPTTASVNANANYFLNLRLARASEVKRNQGLLIYPVSRSWEEGSGFFYQNVENVSDGATWNQCTPHVSWSVAGGDFLTGSTSASVSMSSYPIQDLRLDVTNILRPIVSQSLQSTFHGLVVKFPTEDEQDEDNRGNIKFFSTQTHTVHQPTLEIAWDDQSFATGSLQPVPNGLKMKVIPSNIPPYYSKGDVARIDFVVRDPYPLRSFDSVLRYKNKYYLPTSSYYSIIDSQADVVIVPFDDYSKVHCDSSGSYIILDTSPLYRGRFYGIKLRINQGSYVKTIDLDTQFTITDGTHTSF